MVEIEMHEDRLGASDGIVVQRYAAGERYLVSEDLAQAFVDAGSASAVNGELESQLNEEEREAVAHGDGSAITLDTRPGRERLALRHNDIPAAMPFESIDEPAPEPPVLPSEPTVDEMAALPADAVGPADATTSEPVGEPAPSEAGQP